MHKINGYFDTLTLTPASMWVDFFLFKSILCSSIVVQKFNVLPFSTIGLHPTSLRGVERACWSSGPTAQPIDHVIEDRR